MDGCGVGEHVHEEPLGTGGLGEREKGSLQERDDEAVSLQTLDDLVVHPDEVSGPSLGDVGGLDLVVVLHVVDDVSVDEGSVLGVHPDVGAQVVGGDGQVLQGDGEGELPLLESLDVGLGAQVGVGRPLLVGDVSGEEPPLESADQGVGGELVDLLVLKGGDGPLVGCHGCDHLTAPSAS